MTVLTSLCAVLGECAYGEHVLGRGKEQQEKEGGCRGEMAKSGGREVWWALFLLHLPSLLLSVHFYAPLPLCSVLQLQIGCDRRAVSSVPLSQIEASNSTCASGGGHSGWNRRMARERNPQLAAFKGTSSSRNLPLLMLLSATQAITLFRVSTSVSIARIQRP